MVCVKDTIEKVRDSSEYDFVVITDTAEEKRKFEEMFNISIETLGNEALNQSERFKKLFSHYLDNGYSSVALISGDVSALTKETILKTVHDLKLGKKFIYKTQG